MILPLFSVEVLEEVFTAAAALAVPSLAKSLNLKPLFERLISRKRQPSASSTTDLVTRLRAASAEMDSVLQELSATADERQKKVAALESSIGALVEQERKLKETVAGTEGLSKATVEELARVVGEKLESAEKPKKRRDYALFAAGVIVSGILGIGIEVTKPYWARALHVPTSESRTSGTQNGNQAPNQRPVEGKPK